MRTDREKERHRAAAKLRLIAKCLGEWQVEESLLVSRKHNNKLFDSEMHIRDAAKAVYKGYE